MMTELPDLFDAEPLDVRTISKQQGLTSIYYLLVAAGQNKLQVRASAKSSRQAEMQHHPDPTSIDWDKQKRIHLYGEDPGTGMTYCVTFTPGKGASVFVPPSYELAVRHHTGLNPPEGRKLYPMELGKSAACVHITNLLDVPRALGVALVNYLTGAAQAVQKTGKFHPVASQLDVDWQDWILNTLTLGDTR